MKRYRMKSIITRNNNQVSFYKFFVDNINATNRGLKRDIKYAFTFDCH